VGDRTEETHQEVNQKDEHDNHDDDARNGPDGLGHWDVIHHPPDQPKDQAYDRKPNEQT
jgi:hypothetical protein